MPTTCERALVFDFGNVLAFFSHQQLCEQIAALSQGKATAEQVRTAIFGSGRHQLLEAGKADAERFLCDLQSEICPAAALSDLRRAYTDIFETNPRVCELIPQLSEQAPIFLASNTDLHHWNHFSKLLAPTLAHFTGIVKSFEVGCRKPAAEFFQKLVAQIGLPAGDCIFIDDLPENVAAGCEAGLQGIVYSPETDLLLELRACGIR